MSVIRSDENKPVSRRPLAVALAAGALGFLVNGFPLTGFYPSNVEMVLGGLFHLCVASLYGPFYGLLAALLASSRTIFLWGHPFAVLVLGLEGLVVGWLVKRRRRSLLEADLAFWVVLGLPLFAVLLGLEQPLAVIKHAANGLLNVLVAESLLLFVLPRWAVLSADWPARRSLRSYLEFALLLAAWLPLTLVVVYESRAIGQRDQERAARQMTEVATALANHIQSLIQDHRSTLVALGSDIDQDKDFDIERLNRRLEVYNTHLDGFLTMIVADATGMIRASHPTRDMRGQPIAGRHSVADREYFRQARDTLEPYVSQAFQGRGFGSAPVVAVSAPLRDRRGHFRGIVQGSLNLPHLREVIRLFPTLTESGLLILDRDQRVVWSERMPYRPLQELANDPQVQQVLRSDRQLVSLQQSPRAFPPAQLAVKAQVPEVDWVVLVQLPASAVYRETQQALYLNLLVLVGGFLFALALARPVSARLAVPLERLAERMRRARPRDQEAPTGDTHSEIAQLSSDFEALTGQVQRHYEELAKSEEKFATAFRNSPDPIMLSDLASGRFLDVNEGFTRATGYTRDEAIGRTSLELNLWVQPEVREKMIALLRERGSFRDLEAEFRARAGEIRVGLGAADVIEVDGRACILSIVRDITDRKRLEEQLRQAQKMEALGRLSGGIAHDFNNILHVISGYSELLREQLDPQGPRSEYLAVIEEASLRGSGLTRQLLAFSHRQPCEPRLLSINAVTAGVEKMLRGLIGSSIEIKTRLKPDLAAIRADQGHIEQVILNLVVNARDAMPDGGQLQIETANVELDDAQAHNESGMAAGRYVLLQVSDTGVGMDAATQSRLFEPFFTTKGPGRGTGLGLATVHGIVQQNRGYIHLESQPGRGTTFRIYFPRVDEPVEADTPAEIPTTQPERASATATILLVEDEAPLRWLLHTYLEREGYTVFSAKNGQKAMEICHQYSGEIHLLVTDVVLPGISGSELARQLRAVRPRCGVLRITGCPDGDLSFSSDQSDAGPIIYKPVRKDDLFREVRQALANRNELSAV